MKASKFLIRGHQGKIGSTLYRALNQLNHSVLGMNRQPIPEQIYQHKPDIIIDVTSALTIHQSMPHYIQSLVPVIIGTSGITPQQAIDYCKQSSQLYIVPNFSLSFHSFVAHAIDRHQTHPITRIEETHHETKIDKPSGSALYLSHLFNAPIQSFRVNRYIAQHTLIDRDHNRYQHSIVCPSEFTAGALKVINTALHLKGSGIILPGF